MSSSGSTFPATLSYVSFGFTIVSFVVLLLNLLGTYVDIVSTLRNAPDDIRDALGNLRQQICEERASMRQQLSELRARARAHVRQNPGEREHAILGDGSGRPRRRRRKSVRKRGGSRYRHSTSDSNNEPKLTGDRICTMTLDASEQTLQLHARTLDDIWTRFKNLERPFLVRKPLRAEAISRGDDWRVEDMDDEKVRDDVEKYGEFDDRLTTDLATGGRGNGGKEWLTPMPNWTALYHCDLTHRFIWWRVQGDVRRLGDIVQRLVIMRIEREASCCMAMINEMREWMIQERRWEGGGNGGTGHGPRGGGGGGGGSDGSFSAPPGPPSVRGSSRPPPRAKSASRARSVYETSSSSPSSDEDAPRKQNRGAGNKQPAVFVGTRPSSRPPSVVRGRDFEYGTRPGVTVVQDENGNGPRFQSYERVRPRLR